MIVEVHHKSGRITRIDCSRILRGSELDDWLQSIGLRRKEKDED